MLSKKFKNIFTQRIMILVILMKFKNFIQEHQKLLTYTFYFKHNFQISSEKINSAYRNTQY